MDPRTLQLAKNLVNFSVKVQSGEKVWVELTGADGADLARACVAEIYAAGGLAFPHVILPSLQRSMLLGLGESQAELMGGQDRALMAQMDGYIGINASENASESADVPMEKLNIYDKLYSQPVHFQTRLNKKWVVLRYPNAAMAQAYETSQEAFTDYFYKVCNLDYGRMDRAMDPLKELMERTDKVRITGPGTDISFSIKGIPVAKCAGEANIPDGEIFTAPVKDSVSGVIRYNTPSNFKGFTFENVCLTFEKGRVVKATANDNARVEAIFAIDEGARYVGEFAIGVNPYITKAMKNTLFDEKIMGSIHFTPGNAYDDVPNGNHSAIHWDLVLIQTEAYGGGEIWFDGVLIRKDGRFVVKELDVLNPENLM